MSAEPDSVEEPSRLKKTGGLTMSWRSHEPLLRSAAALMTPVGFMPTASAWQLPDATPMVKRDAAAVPETDAKLRKTPRWAGRGRGQPEMMVDEAKKERAKSI
jgi:hypothetical protein